MRTPAVAVGAVFVFGTLSLLATSFGTRAGEQDRPPVSFKNDVFPVIKKHCLPCHAEDNFNPSGLSLDTYALLMAGGEHGKAVTPSKGAESIIIKKLGPEPPFGKTMPVVKKRQQAEGVVNKLTEEELKILVQWIDEGAQDN